jgi:hypothetical protein
MSRLQGAFAIVMLVFALQSVACSDPGGPDVTPRELQQLSGGEQTSRRGDDAPQPLRVRVMGSDGQPLGGATVQWTVASGQAAMDPATSATNASGEAEARVTNIATVGDVVIRASVQGFPSLIATFIVTALDPCLIESIPAYELGTSLTGALRPLDCEFSDGSLHDFYRFALTAQQAVSIRVRSDSIAPPEIGLWNLQENRNRGSVVTSAFEARMKAILAPGVYAIGVTSLSLPAFGPYELASSQTSTSAEQCEVVFVVRGIAVAQQLAPTDCADDAGAFHDMFHLALHTDDRVILTMASTQFGPRIRLVHELSGEVMADVDGSATGVAMIDFTAQSTAMYTIHSSSAAAQQSGTYTLAVSHPPSAAVKPRLTSVDPVSLR